MCVIHYVCMAEIAELHRIEKGSPPPLNIYIISNVDLLLYRRKKLFRNENHRVKQYVFGFGISGLK